MTPPPPPPGDASSSRRSNHAALGIVWLVVFIDLLGFGIVLPVLPRQAEPYLAGLSPEAKGAVIGVLFSIFSLMQFIFSPVWGRISDRIGRRPVLLISLAGSVVFYALYGLAVSLPASPGDARHRSHASRSRRAPASPARASAPRPRSSPTARRPRSAPRAWP